ncbi:MAG: response regulator transcription factor [Clostridia bacterium]
MGVNAFFQKVLIVEDEVQLSNTLKRLLESVGFIVAQSYAVRDSKEIFLEFLPDVVLLDINLSNENGMHLCQYFKSIHSKVKVVFLTALKNKDTILDAYILGADDYINKPFDFEILLAKLKVVLQPNHSLSVNKTISANYEINESTQIVRCQDTDIFFTANEFKIFKLLVQNANHVVLISDLLYVLYGKKTGNGDTRTISTHISNIRKKLFDAKCKDTVETSYKQGYIFKTDEYY